jgi:hypothetical protein
MKDQFVILSVCLPHPFFVLFSDYLVGSDPDDREDWGVSPRGAGWTFGSGLYFGFLT